MVFIPLHPPQVYAFNCHERDGDSKRDGGCDLIFKAPLWILISEIMTGRYIQKHHQMYETAVVHVTTSVGKVECTPRAQSTASRMA